MTKKAKNGIILASKTPKNDVLTLNYGLPSSFTTLSTWWTTKRGYGLLMKLDARWALPVYPVLKAQVTKKGVKTSYKNGKKRQSTNTIQFLDCKKTKRRPIIAPAIAVRLLKTKIFWDRRRQKDRQHQQCGCKTPYLFTNYNPSQRFQLPSTTFSKLVNPNKAATRIIQWELIVLSSSAKKT